MIPRFEPPIRNLPGLVKVPENRSSKNQQPKAAPPKEEKTEADSASSIHASDYIKKIDSTLPWNKVKLVGYGFVALIGNCLAFLVFPIYLLAIFANREMYRDWFVKNRTKEQIDQIVNSKGTKFLKEILAALKFRAYWYLFLLLVWIFIGPFNIFKIMWYFFLYVFGINNDQT